MSRVWKETIGNIQISYRIGSSDIPNYYFDFVAKNEELHFYVAGQLFLSDDKENIGVLLSNTGAVMANPNHELAYIDFLACVITHTKLQVPKHLEYEKNRQEKVLAYREKY